MTPRGAPGPDDESDLDAQWQDIVARLGDLEDPDDLDDVEDLGDPDLDPDGADDAPSTGAGSGPGRDARSHTVRPAGAPAEPGRRADDPPTGGAEPLSDPRGWAPDPGAEEAEDHFVPPDPGPVLGGDPVLTMAWVVVVAAPLLVVASMIVWRDAPTWVIQAAGAAFLAAVGVLLWRLPHRRDEDDDDPGAVV